MRMPVRVFLAGFTFTVMLWFGLRWVMALTRSLDLVMDLVFSGGP
jgi:hypothetical protein